MSLRGGERRGSLGDALATARVHEGDAKRRAYAFGGDANRHRVASRRGLADAVGNHAAKSRVEVGVASAPHEIAAAGFRGPVGRSPRSRHRAVEREFVFPVANGVVCAFPDGSSPRVQHFPHVSASLRLVRRAAIEHHAVAAFERRGARQTYHHAPSAPRVTLGDFAQEHAAVARRAAAYQALMRGSLEKPRVSPSWSAS